MPKYIKCPPGHEFKVNEKIRLGGREGRIESGELGLWGLLWEGDDCDRDSALTLECFPDLEIAVEEPTISREAAEELKRKFAHCDSYRTVNIKVLIDSMVEKEKCNPHSIDVNGNCNLGCC